MMKKSVYCKTVLVDHYINAVAPQQKTFNLRIDFKERTQNNIILMYSNVIGNRDKE